MEKHKCKLCFKSFANGRALGGHMRSHMLNLYVPPKTEQPSDHNHHHHQQQLAEETESASSSSSSSEDEENEDKGLGYGLRENPKKSIRMVDPEFSFAVGAGSVVLQDRESETESSKNPNHRRSKRIRKSIITEHHDDQHLKGPELKMFKLGKLGTESEPVSSISDTTPEEDVAYCLMMLSRDKWMRVENEADPQEAEQEKAMKFIDDDEEEDESEESDELKYSEARVRKKYKCETCKKVFRSYQALGGHRASHKKIKFNKSLTTHELTETEATNGGGKSSMAELKVHECPVCYRVFSSGQALGGHKRSHVTGSAPITTNITSTQSTPPVAKFAESLIDLNLPAPIDDDEISQIELSAVSDAEFVNPIKH